MRTALLAAIALAVLIAAPPAVAAPPGAMTAAQRAADFAAFCRFVDTEYAYFDVKATDWKRSCAAYASQLGEATDRDRYIGLLERALGELYDPHAHLGTNTARSYRLVPSQTDVLGAWRDGRAVVSAVRHDSAAERAGVKPGAQVLAIDGEPVDRAVARLEPRHLSRPDPAAREWALQVALAGRHERPRVRLSLRSGGEDRELAYTPTTSGPHPLLSQRLIGAVGVVRVHDSLGDAALVRAFDAALDALAGARGLVVDLRDTPRGGTSTVARGIISRLVDSMRPYQRHEQVAEFRQSGIRRVWVEQVAPRGTTFRAPVVVLVGHWTGSMGEGLAIGLNAARGAPVLGEPMAHLLGALGETELPHSHIVVRVPTEKLFHVDGRPREAFVPCPIPGAGVSTDADAELDAAVALAARLGTAPPPPGTGIGCPTLPAPKTRP